MSAFPPSAVGRFWSKVDKNGPIPEHRPELGRCWAWGGKLDSITGYGRIGFSRQYLFVHRFAYLLLVGSIPEGLTVDHLCRNRGCVNPAHLEPVTRGENVLRGESWAGRHGRAMHCPRGHPYDETNTYVVPATGGRQCRACKRLRDARRPTTQATRREIVGKPGAWAEKVGPIPCTSQRVT